MANRFKRRKPIPTGGRHLRGNAKFVKIGPYSISSYDATVLTEYLRNGMKAREAVVSTGTPLPGAHTKAYQILHKPDVMGALNHLLVERRKRVDLELDDVVRYHYEIAVADAREFNCLHWRCCRYCWGIDNQYHFTQAELRNALQKHQARFAKLDTDKRPMFDEEGGDGFDSRKDPQRGPEWEEGSNDGHSCPECNGKGVPVIEEVDLSKLSYGASLIFDGIKVGRDGSVEFKLNANRSKSMEEVTRLLGLARPKRNVVTPDFDAEDDDVIDAILDEAESRGLIGPDDYGKVV
jgi:phage terminase small subunit